MLPTELNTRIANSNLTAVDRLAVRTAIATLPLIKQCSKEFHLSPQALFDAVVSGEVVDVDNVDNEAQSATVEFPPGWPTEYSEFFTQYAIATLALSEGWTTPKELNLLPYRVTLPDGGIFYEMAANPESAIAQSGGNPDAVCIPGWGSH